MRPKRFLNVKIAFFFFFWQHQATAVPVEGLTNACGNAGRRLHEFAAVQVITWGREKKKKKKGALQVEAEVRTGWFN